MRRVAGVLLIVYLVGLVAIAIWPTPVDRPIDGLLFRLIDGLRGSVLGFVTYDRVESAANALLFVPFGLLLGGLLGRGGRWLAFGVCVAATLVIEFIQQVLLPERHADLRDIVANSIGAALGIGVAALIDRARRARSLKA